VTIHSFRRVLRIRRSVYTIPWSPGRALILPHPVPLMGITYFALLEALFLILSRLPVIGAVASGMPWHSFWVLPLWITFAAMTATLDGRLPHRWAMTYIEFRLRPRRRVAGRRVMAEGETRNVGGRVRTYFDEHDVVLHRGRIHGPATVCFAVPIRFRLGMRGGFVAVADENGHYATSDVTDRLEVRPARDRPRFAPMAQKRA
jgi:hypothetical protein